MLCLAASASARTCAGTCSQSFTFRPPYVQAYSGTGPYWKVRCVKLVPSGGKHNLFTFLYRNGVAANDPIYARIGALEISANWKDEWMDGVREQWWNVDLYASEGHFYSVSVKNQPSDTVHDIHTRHGDLAGCGTFGHFLWEVIFDYVEGGTATPTPTNTPSPSHTPTNSPVQTATPSNTPTPALDSDNDGLGDHLEGYPPLPGQGNRYVPDSDGDGLLDGEEDANRNGARDAGETDLRNRDSDSDGYLDGLETARYLSNAFSAASPGPGLDGDGDGLLVYFDPNDNHRDVDADRFLDGYEVAHLTFGAESSAAQRPPLGDVNGDQAVSNVDALIVQSIFLGLTHPLAFAAAHADANHDGHITNVDALVLQSFFLGLLPQFPPGF